MIYSQLRMLHVYSPTAKLNQMWITTSHSDQNLEKELILSKILRIISIDDNGVKKIILFQSQWFFLNNFMRNVYRIIFENNQIILEKIKKYIFCMVRYIENFLQFLRFLLYLLHENQGSWKEYFSDL